MSRAAITGVSRGCRWADCARALQHAPDLPAILPGDAPDRRAPAPACGHVVRRLRGEDVLMLAAGLAFYALVSVAPTPALQRAPPTPGRKKERPADRRNTSSERRRRTTAAIGPGSRSSTASAMVVAHARPVTGPSFSGPPSPIRRRSRRSQTPLAAGARPSLGSMSTTRTLTPRVARRPRPAALRRPRHRRGPTVRARRSVGVAHVPPATGPADVARRSRALPSTAVVPKSGGLKFDRSLTEPDRWLLRTS